MMHRRKRNLQIAGDAAGCLGRFQSAKDGWQRQGQKALAMASPHGYKTIAKLRLTLPPVAFCHDRTANLFSQPRHRGVAGMRWRIL